MNLLQTPITINKLPLKNRLILPPMAYIKGDDASRVTDALCAYYDEKAASGLFGLIVSEHCFVSPDGQASERQISISRDSDIPGLRKLVETIHRHNVPVFAQINHAGGAARRAVTRMEPLSPSGIHSPGLGDPDLPPAILTALDMKRIAADFAAAALRAKEAGFDGVEVHAAHAYLLCQFLSPLLNHRTDEYGGPSITDRLCFPLEVFAAVRAAVGPDYPVSVRLGACDYLPGGNTAADAALAASAFARAGADLLDVSGGACYYRRPGHTEPGYFSDQTTAIRRALQDSASAVPVVLTGGIYTAAQAETFLQNGAADMIGIGRSALKGTWEAGARGTVLLAP